LFELRQPLSKADLTTYETELSQLQANILKPHGRKAAVHLFLTFKRNKQNEARQFLRQTVVTSAAEQAAQKQRHSESHRELLTVLFLSAKGYEYLGFPTNGFSQAFQEGMQRATARLADPPPAQWESTYQKDLHAMLLLAHDSKEELTSLTQTNLDKVSGFAEVSTEFGSNMKNGQGKAIEHFGYRDGISQPVFLRGRRPADTRELEPLIGTEPGSDRSSARRAQGRPGQLLRVSQAGAKCPAIQGTRTGPGGRTQPHRGQPGAGRRHGHRPF
jgi:deferrochelatase/peroxidase EfeB